MRVSFLSVALAAVVLSACGDDTSPSDQGRLRVVHASPDAPAVDVLVDGTQVVTGAAFQQSSPYLPVDAGSRAIRVEPVGSNTAVISANVPVARATDYTVIAANRVANIEALLLTDDNTAPTAGNVKLRLVHGAPSAPNVDIYITAPGASIATIAPTLSNVPFRGFSPYQTVPAGSYQVRITPTGTKTVAIDTGTLTLAAGAVRTAIARDATGGGAPFGVILLADVN